MVTYKIYFFQVMWFSTNVKMNCLFAGNIFHNSETRIKCINHLLNMCGKRLKICKEITWSELHFRVQGLIYYLVKWNFCMDFVYSYGLFLVWIKAGKCWGQITKKIIFRILKLRRILTLNQRVFGLFSFTSVVKTMFFYLIS